MTCTYCGSRYGHEASRCPRCGRKPGDTLNEIYLAPVNSGNLAPQLQAVSVPVIAEPEPRPPDVARPVQFALFREPSNSKVVPIQTYAPERPRSAPPKTPKPSV